mgnify:CR=1 FL=1
MNYGDRKVKRSKSACIAKVNEWTGRYMGVGISGIGARD